MSDERARVATIGRLRSTRQLTLGADKGFDAAEFVVDLRQACVTPHVAQKSRYSAIDGCTTRHEGYALSIKHRKRIEEAFGWAKTIGGMAQTVYRGVVRVCIDPVKICSCYKGDGSDECDDGRRHQAVDGQAKDGAGGLDHSGQDDGGGG